MWSNKNNRVFFLKKRWGGGKFFKNEKALFKAINENTNEELFIFNFESSIKASDFFKSSIKERDRDTQLKVVLGEADKYEEAILNFRIMFEEIAPDSRQKKNILELLRLHGCSKDTFKDIAGGYKTYLLLNITNSVEYYQTLLKCHNFTSLPNKHCYEETINNFEEAKNSLRKNPKKKKV